MATTTRADTRRKEEYLDLHRWMCMAKALDDRMHILVKQGRAPFVGSSRGHEGVQVASTAAGIAYAAKLKGEGSVTLCTYGDGATSQGEFHEGVNFAAVHRLPVVFVCENNSYAISVPIRLQMANPNIADRAAGYGIPGVTVDGTDVPACYAATREAVARARAGEGPTLIDAKIWRINSHTSEDNVRSCKYTDDVLDTGPSPLTEATSRESTADMQVKTVPTREPTPVWQQPSPAAPAQKKGDPDWSKTGTSANGDSKKQAPAWA